MASWKWKSREPAYNPNGDHKRADQVEPGARVTVVPRRGSPTWRGTVVGCRPTRSGENVVGIKPVNGERTRGVAGRTAVRPG